jgi:hypothetical protein
MSRRMRKLFQNEGMVSQAPRSPEHRSGFEAVVEDDFAYLAMEYVKGFSLEEHTRIDKLLPMHRVIGIIFKCCMALDSRLPPGHHPSRHQAGQHHGRRQTTSRRSPISAWP